MLLSTSLQVLNRTLIKSFVHLAGSDLSPARPQRNRNPFPALHCRFNVSSTLPSGLELRWTNVHVVRHFVASKRARSSCQRELRVAIVGRLVQLLRATGNDRALDARSFHFITRSKQGLYRRVSPLTLDDSNSMVTSSRKPGDCENKVCAISSKFKNSLFYETDRCCVTLE